MDTADELTTLGRMGKSAVRAAQQFLKNGENLSRKSLIARGNKIFASLNQARKKMAENVNCMKSEHAKEIAMRQVLLVMSLSMMVKSITQMALSPDTPQRMKTVWKFLKNPKSFAGKRTRYLAKVASRAASRPSTLWPFAKKHMKGIAGWMPKYSAIYGARDSAKNAYAEKTGQPTGKRNTVYDRFTDLVFLSKYFIYPTKL